MRAQAHRPVHTAPKLRMAFSPALSTLRGSPRFDCYFHPALEVYPSSATFEVPSLAVRVASGEWVGRRWVNFVAYGTRGGRDCVCVCVYSMCLLWFVSCLLAKPVTPHPFLPLPFPLFSPPPRPNPPPPPNQNLWAEERVSSQTATFCWGTWYCNYRASFVQFINAASWKGNGDGGGASSHILLVILHQLVNTSAFSGRVGGVDS